jgi:hypothetical protein
MTALDAYLDVARRATTCPNCGRETLCQAAVNIIACEEDADRAAGRPRRMNGAWLTFACAGCSADIWVSLRRTTDGWRQIWRWQMPGGGPQLPTPAVYARDRAWMDDAEIPF